MPIKHRSEEPAADPSAALISTPFRSGIGRPAASQHPKLFLYMSGRGVELQCVTRSVVIEIANAGQLPRFVQSAEVHRRCPVALGHGPVLFLTCTLTEPKDVGRAIVIEVPNAGPDPVRSLGRAEVYRLRPIARSPSAI